MDPDATSSESTGVMSDKEIEARIRGLFDLFPSLRERYNNLIYNPSIHPESCAAIDQQDVLGHFVWEQAIQSLGVADEVIETWRQVYLADVRPVSGHVVLLRTVLETATLTRWLVDPVLTPAQRVRRGILAQLEDISERARFEAVFDRTKITMVAPSKWAEERRAELISECCVRGIRVTNAGGDRLRPEGPTERCRCYVIAPAFGGEAAYRVSSAFAHGRSWTLPFLNRTLRPESATPTGGIVTVVSAHPAVMAAATFWGTMTFAAALADVERYIAAPAPSPDASAPS